ncbi:MAG: cell envelope biogenesis protein OmpA, partial [Alphaproteobacteria bacterium HGW-Alphaproteobacteria-16]
MLAMLAAAPASVVAQEMSPQADESVTIQGEPLPPLTDMPEGPEVEGMISARQGNQVQITTADGSPAVVAVTDATEIRSSGGFL